MDVKHYNPAPRQSQSSGTPTVLNGLARSALKDASRSLGRTPGNRVWPERGDLREGSRRKHFGQGGEHRFLDFFRHTPQPAHQPRLVHRAQLVEHDLSFPVI